MTRSGVAVGALVLTKTGSRRATSRLSRPWRIKGSKRHRIDIAGLDALENLVVKVDGLFLGQPQQDIAKTAVGITAVELEMNLAEAKAAAEVGAAGPALHGVVIGLDRRGPVARPLLVEAALEHAFGIIGQVRGGGRRGVRAVSRGGRISPGDRAGDSGQHDQEQPTRVRTGRAGA